MKSAGLAVPGVGQAVGAVVGGEILFSIPIVNLIQ